MNEVPNVLVDAVRAASDGTFSRAECQGGAFCFVFVKPELAGIDTLEAAIETVIDDYRQRTGDHTNIRIKIEM